MTSLQRWLILVCLVVIICGFTKYSHESENDSIPSKICVAYVYVEAELSEIPDANLFTHYIYSFAEFNDNNDGLIIKRPDLLENLIDLKKQNPQLKVILGIGGTKREGFSEMAGNEEKRRKFVDNCKSIIKDYELDGIDLDWEFPTTEKGGHSASPNDTENYVLLVRDIRKALDKDMWISFYSSNSAKWIDFKKMMRYVSYVNVSGYNLAIPETNSPLKHHCPLYASKQFGRWCIESSINLHLRKGVPPEKILLGIPFYGRGKKPFPGYVESWKYERYQGDMQPQWNDEAKASFFLDDQDNLVLGFDNAKSIEYKCDFIRKKDLAGAFVWHYNADFPDHSLANTLHNCLFPELQK